MGRGGKRKGAGRKLGAATKRSRAIADKATAEGRTPLEVMLRAMNEHYSAQRFDQAAAIAEKAAPYMHPKLQSVMHTGDADKPIVTDSTIRVEFVSADDVDVTDGEVA